MALIEDNSPHLSYYIKRVIF